MKGKGGTTYSSSLEQEQGCAAEVTLLVSSGIKAWLCLSVWFFLPPILMWIGLLFHGVWRGVVMLGAPVLGTAAVWLWVKRAIREEYFLLNSAGDSTLPVLRLVVRAGSRVIQDDKWENIVDIHLKIQDRLFSGESPGFVSYTLVATLDSSQSATVASADFFAKKPSDLEWIRDSWKESWGRLDAGGKYVFRKCFLKYVEYSHGLTPVVVRQPNGLRWTYVDTNGDIPIRAVFQEAHPFSEGLAVVRRGGRYGYIDLKGKVVIPFRYRWAGPFSGGRATVRLNAPDAFSVKYAKIDTSGTILTGDRGMVELEEEDTFAEP